MLQTFYCAFIESVLSFGIVCRFGSPTEAQKKAIRRIMTMSGISFPSMECIYRDTIVNESNSSEGDQRHPWPLRLNCCLLDADVVVLCSQKNRCKLSFVPQSIKFFNE